MEICKNILPELNELSEISRVMVLNKLEKNIYVDFSVINDMSYYNKVVFQGFISGIPSTILSGGCYDNLLKKMGKKSRAIGFAVYLDLLDKLSELDSDYDTDVLLIYENTDSPETVTKVLETLVSKGNRVRVDKKNNGKIKYRRLMFVKDMEMEVNEKND